MVVRKLKRLLSSKCIHLVDHPDRFLQCYMSSKLLRALENVSHVLWQAAQKLPNKQMSNPNGMLDRYSSGDNISAIAQNRRMKSCCNYFGDTSEMCPYNIPNADHSVGSYGTERHWLSVLAAL
jgi:hypothetical protein